MRSELDGALVAGEQRVHLVHHRADLRRVEAPSSRLVRPCTTSSTARLQGLKRPQPQIDLQPGGKHQRCPHREQCGSDVDGETPEVMPPQTQVLGDADPQTPCALVAASIRTSCVAMLSIWPCGPGTWAKVASPVVAGSGALDFGVPERPRLAQLAAIEVDDLPVETAGRRRVAGVAEAGGSGQRARPPSRYRSARGRGWRAGPRAGRARRVAAKIATMATPASSSAPEASRAPAPASSRSRSECS